MRESLLQDTTGSAVVWHGYEKALTRCLTTYIQFFSLLSTEYTRNKYFGECLHNTALLTDNSPRLLFDIILALHSGFEENDEEEQEKEAEEEEEEGKEKEKEENFVWEKSSAALRMTCHWLFFRTLIKEDRILRDEFGPVVSTMKYYLHFVLIAKRAIQFLENQVAQKTKTSVVGDPMLMIKDIRRVAARVLSLSLSLCAHFFLFQKVPVPSQLQLWVALVKSSMTPEGILNWLLDDLNESELREVFFSFQEKNIHTHITCMHYTGHVN